MTHKVMEKGNFQAPSLRQLSACAKIWFFEISSSTLYVLNFLYSPMDRTGHCYEHFILLSSGKVQCPCEPPSAPQHGEVLNIGRNKALTISISAIRCQQLWGLSHYLIDVTRWVSCQCAWCRYLRLVSNVPQTITEPVAEATLLAIPSPEGSRLWKIAHLLQHDQQRSLLSTLIRLMWIRSFSFS